MQRLAIQIRGQNTFFWVRLTSVRQMWAVFLQKLSQLGNPGKTQSKVRELNGLKGLCPVPELFIFRFPDQIHLYFL